MAVMAQALKTMFMLKYKIILMAKLSYRVMLHILLNVFVPALEVAKAYKALNFYELNWINSHVIITQLPHSAGQSCA